MGWEALLFQLLDGLILRCFEELSTENPQQYIREHFDETTGKLDSELVEDAIPQTRRAARLAHRKLPRAERREMAKLSKADLYGLTEKRLLQIMNMPAATFQQELSAVAQVEDGE